MCPHDESRCKTSADVHPRGRAADPGQTVLCQPESLQQWQDLFQMIYPRRVEDLHSHRSVLGLFEELGELSEAILRADRSAIEEELADTFTYIVGVANELMVQPTLRSFSLEEEFLLRYPHGLHTSR